MILHVNDTQCCICLHVIACNMTMTTPSLFQVKPYCVMQSKLMIKDTDIVKFKAIDVAVVFFISYIFNNALYHTCKTRGILGKDKQTKITRSSCGNNRSWISNENVKPHTLKMNSSHKKVPHTFVKWPTPTRDEEMEISDDHASSPFHRILTALTMEGSIT